MADVTDQQVITRLRELLGESDLATTTEKMLRKKLEEEFKVDLTEKKPLIRKEVEAYLVEHGGGDEEEEDEEEEDDNAPGRGSGLGCLLSEPLQAFLGVETMPRTQVVKKLWEYIKANNLQDPKDKRKILLDDKLKTIFTAPLNMFSMNSQLSKHCKTNDADERPASKSKAGDKRSSSAADKGGSKAKKAKTGDDDGGEKKKNNFNKPVRLSKELSEWTGKEEMGRSELTSFFWTYVKENNLQDPSNKQYILCDAKLKKLTGEDRIQGFGIQKFLSPHIIKS
ncbi:hypothetical protein HYH03_018122 [Edaphochlamys debaryana]|uniref:Uncharacterized protein n=1 Tax=Edaphochlamys debaryana TaxID=47281 RepID=A0A836BNM8_9CHLO|nr:hypothetical protein HYH03_018122 [Edaphochlamys debaryana]|eukprot:KAG2482997.1 hypothetical protein HYH03_018122 [Edaphochlamys debaryana]